MSLGIASFLHHLDHAPLGLTEIRVLPRRGAPLTGFFDSPEHAAAAVAPWGDGQGQVYVGLNPRRRGCLTLAPNRLVPGARGGRQEDVVAVTAILIDLDPVRPKGEASTDEELAAAEETARRVRVWFQEQGFARPLVAMSGNGYHLICRVPPQDPNTFPAQVQAFLHFLAGQFDTDGVLVDPAVFDAVRISKLPGTVSIKGANTLERPWRRAVIVDVGDGVADERLAEFVLFLTPVASPATRRPIVRSSAKGERNEPPRPNLDVVLERCAFLHYCRANASSLPEPLWYAMVTNLAPFKGGAAAIHEMSRPYPRYSPRETDAKIAHAQRAPGPHTCAWIADQGFACPWLGRCVAGAPAALPWHVRRTEAVRAEVLRPRY